MDAAACLRLARADARLSQRDLARRTGIAQPTIARIERRSVNPRVDTFERLLRACGADWQVLRVQAVDDGDWTQVEANLRLTPQQRVEKMLAWERLARAMRGARRAGG